MTAALPSAYPHIELDAAGVPYLAGTTLKVVELVAAHLTHGFSPQELRFQFPHLSLGEIHSALAYYWDHQRDLDEDLEQRARKAEKIRGELPDPPVARRLRSLRRA